MKTVPFTNALLPGPKIVPFGWRVEPLVPLILNRGVYVVFNCEIHATNCAGPAEVLVMYESL